MSFLYQQFGLIQALVEVPVLDAFRGGVKFSAYEKKVVLPEEPRKKKWFFWNAKEPAGENQQASQNDFLMEMMKKREDWETEQVRKDEEARKSEDAYFRDEITREELRRMEIYIRRSQLWETVKQALFWKRLYGGAGIVAI